jgi:hypothetical protein
MKMHEIVTVLVARYRKVAGGNDRVHQMLWTLSEDSRHWPTDKTNRWIGFIQGCLFSEGKIDINTERDFTRPLFHSYYDAQGLAKPASVDVTK